jgi:DNA-binding CsgD family transcriptional regulator
VCAEERDARLLRLRLLEELRADVAFDHHVWVLTDPVTAVGSAPVAEVPCMSELPALIRAKYLTEVNRWTSLATGGLPAARSLWEATGGAPARSVVWRELLSRYAVGDVASVVFRDGYGVWGFLDLWRRADRTPFSADEAAHLAAVAAPVTAALRGCVAATFARPPIAQARDAGPAVVLLDDALSARSRTRAAATWLARLLPARGEREPVPAAIYNTAAQLVAAEQGVDPNPASARVHLVDGFWLTLRAARLLSAGPERIAVSIEETSPLDRLEVFALSHGLTPRERDVLLGLGTGRDTRDLARRLHVSENTVQDHLKSIFAKTSARHRHELLGPALGASAADAG